MASSGGTAPYTFAVTAGSLPAGITLGSNGTFSGTPTATGSSSFTVTVKDSSLPFQTATQTFTVVVVAPLAITTATLPGGQVGVAYNQPIVTTGGTLPLGFSLATPAFPPGLLIQNATASSNTDALVGSPTAAGTFTFTETVTDSSTPPQTTSQSYTVTIAPAAAIPAGLAFLNNLQNSIEGQVIAGSPLQVLVTDNNGSPIANLPVTMTLAGPGNAGQVTPPACAAAVLGGTVTQNTNASGIVTFSDLTVSRGGFINRLFATTAGSNAFAESILFNVEGFCDTGSLATGRVFHSAVTLPNGLVLIAGGTSSYSASLNSAFSSAELYNPATKSFTATGTMNSPRHSFTMTLLQNGLVLIAGGYSGSTQLSSAELFDPATNTFTLLTNSMTVGRYQHSATLLPNGKVLIAGGTTPTSGASASAELFDPSSNTFIATTGSMTAPRSLHHADLLSNGHVLLTGGVNGNFVPLASAELYDVVSDTFTATGSMATPREQQASVLLFNGTVLVAGGDTGPNNTAATASAEIYDPSTSTFNPTASAPRVTTGFYHSVPILPDGRAFLADFSATALVYDPAAGAFSATGDMTAVQTQPQTVILPDGTALVAGGVDSNGNSVANAEIFYPIPTAAITFPFTLLSNATQGQPYTQQLLEQGGVGTLTWSLTSTSPPLPTGLTLSSRGLLSGTPTQFGAFTFTAQVTDGSKPTPKTGTFTYALVVLPQFQFFPLELTTAFSGTAYSASLPIVGGTPPYTSTLTGGILPAGLTFANGTISGTTTALGTYSLTFQATDSSVPPQSTTATLTLGVTTPLAITTTTLPNGALGSSYSGTIATSGGLGTIVVGPTTTTGLPPGLVFNPNGVISGTPTQTGTFSFTVEAVDQSLPPQTATQPESVTITTATTPLSLSPNPLNLFGNDTGNMTVTLSAPAGANGQTVGLGSSNSSLASVPASVNVLPNSSSATFQVLAGANAGSATITATAPGSTSGTATVVVTTRPMSLATDGPLLAINRTFNATVTLAQPAGAGGVTVTLAANPSGLVSIAPASQTIAAGQTAAVFSLTAGSGPGSLVLTASASGFTNATAPLTVTTAEISLQTGVTVAPGQSVGMALNLSQAAPPGGLTVNLTSSDPSIATVTPSLLIPAGAETPSANPQITGVLPGTVNITAAAIGFAPDTRAVQVVETASLSPNPFSIPATRTSNITLNISAPAPQPNGLTFNLAIDNTSFATVPLTATVPPGQLSISIPVTGVAQGVATLSAAFPGIATATASINVGQAPTLGLNVPTNLGQNLQVDSQSISLGATPPASESLTLTSSSPSVLLANTPAGPFSQSITLALAQGSFSVPTFSMQGLASTGSAQLTAAATGYANGTATVNLTPSGFAWNIGSFNTTTTSADSTLSLVAAQLDPATLTVAQVQNVRTGVSVSVTVSSSNTAVGTIVTSPVVFNGDTNSVTTTFHPLAVGTTSLLIATPAGFTTPNPAAATAVTATVN